eukprot:c33743_g1_i1 orf=89-418(+)
MVRSPCVKCKLQASSIQQFKGVSRAALLTTVTAQLLSDGNEERKKRVSERRQLMQALTALHRPSLPANHALLQGKLLHDLIIRHSFEAELFLVNNLLSIYASCGLLLSG